MHPGQEFPQAILRVQRKWSFPEKSSGHKTDADGKGPYRLQFSVLLTCFGSNDSAVRT